MRTKSKEKKRKEDKLKLSMRKWYVKKASKKR